MGVLIELPKESEATLRERAQSVGLTAEQYAMRILERELGTADDASADESAQSFIEDLLGPIAKLPKEAFDGLPTDGASQHDHYIYGTPKRDDL